MKYKCKFKKSISISSENKRNHVSLKGINNGQIGKLRFLNIYSKSVELNSYLTTQPLHQGV